MKHGIGEGGSPSPRMTRKEPAPSAVNDLAMKAPAHRRPRAHGTSCLLRACLLLACLLLACLLLACLLIAPLPAGSARAGQPEREAGAAIRSACEVDYPPFSLVGAQGEANGFSVELLRAALAAMGREVTFRTGPWEEVRGWLETGQVQALPLVGRTPEREPRFDFTFPYMSLHGAIVVRDGTTGIRDLQDLRGRRVAVMRGDNAEEFLRREDRGIEILPTTTFVDALRDLSGGRCDAVVAQRLVALRLLQEHTFPDLKILEKPIEGFRQDFCFAVREGDRETLALLNEGLALVMADGTYRHLHAKWFAALQLPARRRIVVGGDRSFPPYEYLDEAGEPAGFNVDLTRAIAREMELDVEVRLGPWAQVRGELARGELDAVQGMFYSAGRDLSFDFSPSYLAAQYVGVVRRGGRPPPETLEQLRGLTLAVQDGDILHDFAVQNGLGERLAAVGSQEDALREVAEGRRDCALVSRLTALYWIEKRRWDRLVAGSHSFLSPEYCYAVPQSQKPLLAQITEGLKVVDQTGELRRIREKWLGPQQGPAPSLLHALRVSAMVLVPLLLGLLAVLLWSWTLRRQVARKTREVTESTERFRYFFDSANVGKSITLPTGEINVNQAYADLLGYAPEELTGKKWQELTPEDEIEATQRELDPLLRGEKDATRFGKSYLRKDGGRVWADVSVRVRRGAGGEPLYFVTTVVDVTEQKRAEEALRESEQHFRNLADSGTALIWTSGTDGRFDYFNRTWLAFRGRSPQEESGTGWTAGIHPEDRDSFLKTCGAALAGRQPFRVLLRLERRDGAYRWVQMDGAPRTDSEGRFIGFIGHCLDVTEFKLAREQVEHLIKVLRAIRDVNQLIVHERDPERLVREACRLMVDNRGYAFAMVVRTDAQERPVGWAEAGRDLHAASLKDLFQGGRLPPCCRQARERDGFLAIRRGDGLCRACPASAATGLDADAMCIRLQSGGNAFGYLAVVMEPDLAVDPEEERLFREMAGDIAYALRGIESDQAREESERKQQALEAQLVQAQKLESVGRLAGGVAHDYNNMLSIIMGYAELALSRLDPADPIHPLLREILNAGTRSMEITRQLLAFARKQTVAPKVLLLNDTLEGMLKMLRNLIGEDVDLAWLPGRDLWPVWIDPAQVDQILVNLCVNARDAIEGTGRITIESGNASFDEAYCREHPGFLPGEYVFLDVTDDGKGMPAGTLEMIFEPFFTTKGPGQGTGLGLSTVYGIVQQNGGFIRVDSTPGRGSAFRVHLPRHTVRVETRREEPKKGRPPRGSETVLLVEDEEALLQMTETMLRHLGYSVLPASTPGEAIRLAAEPGRDIRLLITDVIMPEMNGRELAEAVRSIRPGIKHLFVSGYSTDVIAPSGVLEEGVRFVQKPFTMRELGEKIREALDG